MRTKILIIEDDVLIRRELKILLENAMYEVTALTSFDRIVPQIKSERPDLILLDINLPDCSGFDLCTQIREEMNVPVIFLTGRTDSMDELTGILKGADDYITKPYQAPILLARINAVLKRTKISHEKDPAHLSHKGVILDTAGCSLVYMDRQADLTKTEMKILHQLFAHPGTFISRMDLTEYLWENQIFIDDNTLSVHITRVREKLRSVGVDNFIETKRGIGYRI